MFRVISLYRHAVASTPAELWRFVARTSPQQRPSPNSGWVGFRITRFEACSAFTHVTACLLADHPKAAFSIEGFDDFVTSIAAPIATGWNDSCRAGVTPAEDAQLFTAHVESRCGAVV